MECLHLQPLYAYKQKLAPSISVLCTFWDLLNKVKKLFIGVIDTATGQIISYSDTFISCIQKIWKSAFTKIRLVFNYYHEVAFLFFFFFKCTVYLMKCPVGVTVNGLDYYLLFFVTIIYNTNLYCVLLSWSIILNIYLFCFIMYVFYIFIFYI